MKYICKKEYCTGCGICSLVCPKTCIHMIEDIEGFLFPEIDESKCINCGLCQNNCHILNNIESNIGKFYMGWNINDGVLLSSSSGGVFTALTTYIFANNGVVVGAEMEQKSRDLKHVIITSVKELDRIRLSKYYQSNCKCVFVDVKKYVNNNIPVLFCGTTCQIAALKNYLGKNYDSLITVDVLCHGVSSKKAVDAYIESKQKKYKKRVISIFFRVKSGEIGWMKSTRMKIIFDDNSTLITNNDTDTFFTAFNNNLILRESCYRCKYCGENRISDFTLADYWGIRENEITLKQKWYGVSLIIVNSQKAQNILNEVMTEIEIYNIDKESAIRNNLALLEPNSRPVERNFIFNLIRIKGFDRAIYELLKYYYIKTVIRHVLFKIIGEKNYIKISNYLRKYKHNI